jgi:hypothetical protein
MGTMKYPDYATVENIAVLAIRAIGDIEAVSRRQYVPKSVRIIIEHYNNQIRCLHAHDRFCDS